MNWLDFLCQTLLAVGALTALNRLVYHDSLPASIAYAVSIVACFWLGRGGIRLLKRRKRPSPGSVQDD